MKIGKGPDPSTMVYVEVDLTRNTEQSIGRFMIPTKTSILRGLNDVYFVSLPRNGEGGRVWLYKYDNYYVEWNGKIYHMDSPEKYDILVNIIGTDFALAQLG